MKKIFIISMFVGFVTICSCQKQNSAAEQQLTRRQTALDARETALDKRDQALDKREGALSERERALAEREKAIANAVPPLGQTSDPAQVKAVRRPWRWVLPGLRVAALLALAMSFARPIALRTKPAGDRGPVLVLLMVSVLGT